MISSWCEVIISSLVMFMIETANVLRHAIIHNEVKDVRAEVNIAWVLRSKGLIPAVIALRRVAKTSSSTINYYLLRLVFEMVSVSIFFAAISEPANAGRNSSKGWLCTVVWMANTTLYRS